MKEIKSFGHLGIPTSDIDRAVEFYSSLGFKVVNTETIPERGLRVAFLTLDDFMLEIYQGDGINPVCGSINHIALEVSDISTLFDKIKRSEKYKIISEVEELPFWKNGIKYFKIEDADCVVIEFCERL